MKKLIALAIFVGLPLLAVLTYWNIYNGLVSSDEAVRQTYAQVQNVMQRQADLIPNLVETVKGYAAHENKTLTEVTEARSKLSAVARLDPAKLAGDPELQKKLIEAQAAMGQAINGINATVTKEAYPQLQANENFKTLMAELSGSQNRIAVERRRNQLAVQAYNLKTRTALSGLVAQRHGFDPKPYFEASTAAQAGPPQVKF